MATMSLEFGDGVRVTKDDGTEEYRHYLGGPVQHEGREVIWVCNDHEWTNATVHFGRDPEGTPFPVESVRPAN